MVPTNTGAWVAIVEQHGAPERAEAQSALGRAVEPPRPRPRGHPFSGLSALFLLASAAAIFLLARWAGQPAENGAGGRTIQGMYGLVVACALGVLILVYAWAHHLAPSVAKPAPKTQARLEQILGPLGVFFTRVDFFLVFRIATICGAGPYEPLRRAVHFLLYFAIAIGIAWLAPPPWGLAGVVMALLGILSLNRIWSWVEEDRRNYVLNGHYEVADHATLGIGFAEDHRTAALTSLALMIVVMPLALMQMSAFGIFETEDGSPLEALSAIEWFVFFGGEMAKSVPFVDWSEVYGAETLTPITPNAGGGQHAVFFVRALVDLVLLAGFIQAFELSNRLARQKANFRDPDNPERILDPFLERDAFRDIALFTTPKNPERLETGLIAGVKGDLDQFTKYSNQQIRRVLMRGEAPPFWRPDHEIAVATIAPYREGVQSAPQFFIQVYDQGTVSEASGDQTVQRPAHARTQIAAIIATLGREGAGYAQARETAYRRLAKFVTFEDERVWSGAACALAEIRDHLDFPADAPAAFAAALTGDAPARHSKRTRLLNQALAHIANSRRPTADDKNGRPHYAWAVEILNAEVREQTDPAVRRSAIGALEEVVFLPGALLDETQGVLGALVEELTPNRWSARRLAPWLAGHRLRRLAERCAGAISKYENASPERPSPEDVATA